MNLTVQCTQYTGWEALIVFAPHIVGLLLLAYVTGLMYKGK